MPEPALAPTTLAETELPRPSVEPIEEDEPATPAAEPKEAAARPKVAAPARPRKRSASAKRKPAVAPTPAEPDVAVVQAELASLEPRALTTRADTLYAQGHTGVAASYYRRALDLDPDYAPALVGIGRSILRAEKYEEAMDNATRALQLARGVDARPGLEAEAIYQMARVHLQRGELDAARRLFRQSISLPGTPASAWFYLGEALWTDNSPAAREAYEQYLKLVPSGHLADRARRAIR
jgi:tetratricopeptide (TPR) repeat protein